MNVQNPPGPVSATQPYLLANAIGIDANSLATTNLNWLNGASAANSFPLFLRVYRVTGTLSLLIGTLKLNSLVIQTVAAAESLVLAATSSALQYPLSSAVAVQVIPAAGTYAFTEGTVNGSSSTITAEVWGIRTS